jgi:hypothetical protein
MTKFKEARIPSIIEKFYAAAADPTGRVSWRLKVGSEKRRIEKPRVLLRIVRFDQWCSVRGSAKVQA